MEKVGNENNGGSGEDMSPDNLFEEIISYDEADNDDGPLTRASDNSKEKENDNSDEDEITDTSTDESNEESDQEDEILDEEEISDEEDTDDEDLVSFNKTFFEYAKEKGFIVLPDSDDDQEFEFNGSSEQLEELITNTQEAQKELLKKEAMEDLSESLPDTGRDLLNYMLNGGNDVEEYYKLRSFSYDQLDLSDETVQESVLKQFYSATTQFSEEKIDKLVKSIDAAGNLDSEAKEAVTELKKMQESQLEQMNKQIEIDRKAQEEENKKMQEELVGILGKSNEILGYPINQKTKNELPNFLFETNNYGKDESGNKIQMTPFQYRMNEAMQDPEKFLMLATFLYNDFSLESVKKKVKKETNLTLKEILKRNSQSSGPSAGNFRNKGTKATGMSDETLDLF